MRFVLEHLSALGCFLRRPILDSQKMDDPRYKLFLLLQQKRAEELYGGATHGSWNYPAIRAALEDDTDGTFQTALLREMVSWKRRAPTINKFLDDLEIVPTLEETITVSRSPGAKASFLEHLEEGTDVTAVFQKSKHMTFSLARSVYKLDLVMDEAAVLQAAFETNFRAVRDMISCLGKHTFIDMATPENLLSDNFARVFHIPVYYNQWDDPLPPLDLRFWEPYLDQDVVEKIRSFKQ